MTIYLIILIGCIASFFLFAQICSWFLLHPRQSKLIGGRKIQGLLPSMLETMPAQVIAALPINDLVKNLIAEKVNKEKIMNDLRPGIEGHVDNFLTEKIKTAFPLLFGMLGEKTLSKFKAAFMDEVELVLPKMIDKYSHKLSEVSIGAMVKEKLMAQIKERDLLGIMEEKIAPKLLQLKIAATVFGLVSGGLICLVVYFVGI